ncbi:MAG TPA: pyridoxamine 5'-phosphate oxidase family protein [Sporichthya sp.]|nr:pyridoxamine 5'-phosphate oxidase family protein [Sporichthya sp.]
MTQRFVPTARTRPNRLRERVQDDVAGVHAVIDAGPICHVGFSAPDGPTVLPTLHVRIGDQIYLHGSTGSWLRRVEGQPICLTVTCLDGIVLARSTFHSSMNYRCAVVFGTLRTVTDEREKLAALDALVERISPGRSREARGPNARELSATSVVALRIDEASAKVRTGGPNDDEEDLSLDVWAGVVPVRTVLGEPEPDGAPPRPLPPGALAPGWATV